MFVYNRPEHTERTISTLKTCRLADQSELYIFSDGPKSDQDGDQAKVLEVRKIINNVKGFKKVHVIERDTNNGLAKSIISATNYAFKFSDRVITLEDDVLAGKYFLEYMNTGLQKYDGDNKVYMISGYAFSLPFHKRRRSNFFLQTGTSQAWATWKDKWASVNFEPTDYNDLKKSRWLRFKFNFFGSTNYSDMLIDQMEKNKVSSWAIRHRWHMFKHKGLTLFPAQNLIDNIGWDGSGEHCGEVSVYRDNSELMDTKCDIFPQKLKPKFINTFLLVYFSYNIRISEYLKYKFSKK